MFYHYQKQKVRREHNHTYYVIGLPFEKNKHTGNYSFAYSLIKNPKHDFNFVLSKSDGKIVASTFVPKSVVCDAAKVIWIRKKVKNPENPEELIEVGKPFPVCIISNDVVNHWKDMDEYKDRKFI